MDIINDYEGYYLHGFPCFYYSQYKEESEYLFFGGHYQIKVESVRNMLTLENCQSSIKPLAQFSRIFNGDAPQQDDDDMSVSDVSMVKCLCDNEIGFGINKNERINQYIYKCFKAYSQNKTYIILNIEWIKDTYKDFRDLFFYDIKHYFNTADVSDKIFSVTDKSNMFTHDLFRLLPNLQTIVLITTNINGSSVYPLSLSYLLSQIENTSLNKVIIKATRKSGKSWLMDMWSSKEIVSEMFANRNYQMKYQTQPNSEAGVEDNVIIYKNK